MLTRKNLNRWAAIVLALLLAGQLACVRGRGGESPSELREIKKAVYSAQAVAALEGWSDETELLLNNAVFDAETAAQSYDINDRVLNVADLVRNRLREGAKPGGLIPQIESALADVETAQRLGVVTIKSERGRQIFTQVIFGARFTLGSIKAVLAALAEPRPAEQIAEARRTLRAKSVNNEAWWTEAVLIAQRVAVRWVAQSRMSGPEAWADADQLSAALHSKNRARLGSLDK